MIEAPAVPPEEEAKLRRSLFWRRVTLGLFATAAVIVIATLLFLVVQISVQGAKDRRAADARDASATTARVQSAKDREELLQQVDQLRRQVNKLNKQNQRLEQLLIDAGIDPDRVADTSTGSAAGGAAGASDQAGSTGSPSQGGGSTGGSGGGGSTPGPVGPAGPQGPSGPSGSTPSPSPNPLPSSPPLLCVGALCLL